MADQHANPRAKICYLAAGPDPSANDQRARIHSVLQDINVVVGDPPRMEPRPGLLPERSNILQADFAIYVVSARLTRSELVEIGLILGTGRPLLIVAPRGLSLPLLLDAVPRIAWDLRDDACRFQINAFAQSCPLVPQPRGARLDSRRSRNLEAQIKGVEVQQAVLRMLNSWGYQTVSLDELQMGDAGADAAIWVSDLEPFNPVIVEVSSRPFSNKKIDQLFRYLASADLHLGILFVPDYRGQADVIRREGRAVLVIGIERAEVAPDPAALIRPLVAFRNHLVHLGD